MQSVLHDCFSSWPQMSLYFTTIDPCYKKIRYTTRMIVYPKMEICIFLFITWLLKLVPQDLLCNICVEYGVHLAFGVPVCFVVLVS